MNTLSTQEEGGGVLPAREEATMASFPRVLFITSAAFNSVTGGGITFSNLFRGWPKDRLATVHNDTVPVTTDVCKRYYRLQSAELRRWLIDRADPQVMAGGTGGTPGGCSRLSRLRPLKKAIVGNAWPDIGRLTPELEAWIAEFNPQVLYTILGGIGTMDLIEAVRARFNLPLVTHVMDDWPAVLYGGGLMSPLLRWRMNRRLRHLFSVSAVRLGIGEAMCEAYQQRYGHPFEAFQNTVDVDRFRRYRHVGAAAGSPARILYVGSIFNNAQLYSLVDCCHAVARLRQGGRDIRLDIYSPDFLAAPFRSLLEIDPAVRLHPPITDDDAFFSTIGTADVLLLPVNFDEDSVRLISYSMPTKLPAYLLSGTPVLGYGPMQTAQMSYLSRHGCGHPVSRRGVDAVLDGLVTVLDDAGLRARLAERALAVVERSHHAGHVRNAFQSRLARVSKPVFVESAPMTSASQTENTRTFFDSYAATWGQHYRAGHPQARRIELFRAALAARLPDGGQVLDLGCGSGEITAALAAGGLTMTGADLSPAMIQVAQSTHAVGKVAAWVHLGNDRALPFADGGFDAVVSSSVLEYVTNPAEQLREVARILKPGGWYIATVPDMTDGPRLAEEKKRRLANNPIVWAFARHTRWRSYCEYLRLSINRWPLADWETCFAAAGLHVVPEYPSDTGLVMIMARLSESAHA